MNLSSPGTWYGLYFVGALAYMANRLFLLTKPENKALLLRTPIPLPSSKSGRFAYAALSLVVASLLFPVGIVVDLRERRRKSRSGGGDA